ncbi:hypothetical protein RO3G_15858 [Rhizopus delemar RA 99-880]|uniref:Uncharacterized protein n=1 Tax=Rhizopus delemar (strain RA 99-880 / ATCC MYA-4621 / FGSC 9543 / NRRL 43880) TaxID=246409 RepID=I1CRR7_RHIO9|nr:hypothetical protein RO3G_15858 [Rhizopus delemar RA 99-880]|eukprot:EIE91147.1 hypothetical protein RO3G_15858 [Rhizopus delemar RA 99-880]
MVELSRFFLTRDNVDDVMLVPTIMEKLCQLQRIIQNTIDKLYQAIQEPSSQVGITSYMRISRTDKESKELKEPPFEC